MHFQAISEPLSDILLTSPDFGFIMLNKKKPDSVDNPLSGLNTACCRFVNSLLFREFVGYFAELFRRQFELFAVEIHVVFALNGDQMCAWGTSRPKTTTATLAHAISRLILAATSLAKSIMPASVRSSRSKI